MQEDKDSDLRKFRIGPLTLLELMALLAVLGIVITLVLSYFLST